MIRSSKLSLKFSNTNKLDKIKDFITEYKRICQIFINNIWEEKKRTKLVNKEQTKDINSWLSSRAIQACGKQAAAIVYGTKKKFKQREFAYKELLKKGHYKKARKLKAFIDKNPISLPNLDKVNPELDSRFVNIELDKTNSFDCWISLTSLGNKLKLRIPLKRTKHFNQLYNVGIMKGGIRLSEKDITFNFDIEEPEIKFDGKTIGLDIGIKKVFACSDNQIDKEDKDGWTLSRIQDKLCLRKKGSKGFQEAVTHRKNFINWSLNQLNLDDVKTLKLEDIKDVRRGKRSSRYLSHWTYTDIKSKLGNLCIEHGVQIEYINPKYTSQRCSKCGWVMKSNRKGEQFKCKACGYACDADLNASFNISFNLCNIPKGSNNRLGFYWKTLDEEPIVPHALKT